MLVLQALIVMIGSIIITEIFSMIPGIRTILGLNYYKMRKNYWEQKNYSIKKEIRENYDSKYKKYI